MSNIHKAEEYAANIIEKYQWHRNSTKLHGELTEAVLHGIELGKVEGFESRQGEVDALKADNEQLAQAILRWEKYSIEKDSGSVDFAKAMVHAALHAAAEQVELKDTDEKIHCLLGEDAYRQEVDKDSIIYAFTDKEVEDNWNNPA